MDERISNLYGKDTKEYLWSSNDFTGVANLQNHVLLTCVS